MAVWLTLMTVITVAGREATRTLLVWPSAWLQLARPPSNCRI